MANVAIEWAEKHPAIVVGGVVVLGLGVYLLLTPASSTAASNSGTASASVDAAALAYQENQDNIAAAQSSQNSQDSFQLTAQQQGFEGQLALQQETDQTQIAEQNTAAAVTEDANGQQLQLGLATLSTQLAALTNTNLTTQNIAQISANENTTIAATNANVAVTESNNLTSLGVTQANDNAKVQETISNNSAQTSALGGLFGFLGGLL